MSFFSSPLKDIDNEIHKAINLELDRQQNQIELIASENIVSKAVLEAQGSIMTNKYAEGYASSRYYGGCEFVDIAEDLAIKRLQKLNRRQKAVPTVKARGKSANSDHHFFTEKGVRSFFIYTMGQNKNYHDVYDTYENLSFSSFENLSRLFDSFLRRF